MKKNAWFEDIAHAVQTSKKIHNFSKFQVPKKSEERMLSRLSSIQREWEKLLALPRAGFLTVLTLIETTMKENNRSEIQEWNTGIPIGISKKHPTVLHYPRQMRRIGETLDLHFSFDLLLVLTALFYKFPRHELIFFEGNSSLFQDMTDMSRISNILQAVFAVNCRWLDVGKTDVQRILPSRSPLNLP